MIDCIVSEEGFIIPIHNISLISQDGSYYVWTNNNRYKLSEKTYSKLLSHLNTIIYSWERDINKANEWED